MKKGNEGTDRGNNTDRRQHKVASVPGSGKTFVLTYRIAYLITELFVEPSSIVALTFTNKAASQMKHRLRNIVGDNANCFTGTFHGYCNMFLKEEIHRLTFPKTFTILDKKADWEMLRIKMIEYIKWN